MQLIVVMIIEKVEGGGDSSSELFESEDDDVSKCASLDHVTDEDEELIEARGKRRKDPKGPPLNTLDMFVDVEGDDSDNDSEYVPSYGQWSLSGIPCCHAIAAMFYAKVNPDDYVAYWLKKDMNMKAYSYFLQPINGEEWPKTKNEFFLPPLNKRMPGRPKKNRRQKVNEERPKTSTTEISIRGRVMTCLICKQPGHNKKRCSNKDNMPKEKIHVKRKRNQDVEANNEEANIGDVDSSSRPNMRESVPHGYGVYKSPETGEKYVREEVGEPEGEEEVMHQARASQAEALSQALETSAAIGRGRGGVSEASKLKGVAGNSQVTELAPVSQVEPAEVSQVKPGGRAKKNEPKRKTHCALFIFGVYIDVKALLRPGNNNFNNYEKHILKQYLDNKVGEHVTLGMALHHLKETKTADNNKANADNNKGEGSKTKE
ncbi:hypothetical protein IFM89_010812 [Coptis chinensis]|uniref:CCHC-type domain-containing protein n=1 Tax=Coptis chinensis TaxID=261450 RepID=A0A835M595_9MAGN|nr:hypothetical protein IFM89_010812 [Coptis chinensis]